MRSIVKAILIAPLALLVSAMLIAFYFGAPAALIDESIELFRMRSTTNATVTGVQRVYSAEGSRPQVDYQYVVKGVQYTSHRYTPGWLANTGYWTGGGSGIKNRFVPGQTRLIHYDSANPSRACLEYGWFKWSVGFALGVWGTRLTKSRRSTGRVWRATCAAMILSGAGLIILGPDVVPVAQLHWYALGFTAVFGVSALYLQFRSQKTRTALNPA